MQLPSNVSTGIRMNAALSLFTGAVLTAAPSAISNRLGLDITPWLLALGIALLGHAAALEWAARRDDPLPWLRLNLAIITPYPAALVVLAASPIIEPGVGKALLVLDALCVTIVAVVQWSGLRQSRPAAATLRA